ncbi:hypothetical protein KBD61_06025 [Patescibacteria group bacterium]|nr:hypothetical protein [Patescibacteria group bacterium]MBP9710545.1 hypothetical protein [Patescibacteria group bacterium]
MGIDQGTFTVKVSYEGDGSLQEVLPGSSAAHSFQGWRTRATPIPRSSQEVTFYFWSGEDSDSLNALPSGYRYPNIHEVAALLRGLRMESSELWFPGVVRPHGICQSVREGYACQHPSRVDFLAVRVLPEGVKSFYVQVHKVFRGWDDDRRVVLVPLDQFDRRERRNRLVRRLGMAIVPILVFAVVLAILFLR